MRRKKAEMWWAGKLWGRGEVSRWPPRISDLQNHQALFCKTLLRDDRLPPQANSWDRETGLHLSYSRLAFVGTRAAKHWSLLAYLYWLRLSAQMWCHRAEAHLRAMVHFRVEMWVSNRVTGSLEPGCFGACSCRVPTQMDRLLLHWGLSGDTRCAQLLHLFCTVNPHLHTVRTAISHHRGVCVRVCVCVCVPVRVWLHCVYVCACVCVCVYMSAHLYMCVLGDEH